MYARARVYVSGNYIKDISLARFLIFIQCMKKIVFDEPVKKFGHVPFDYKKDGSFKKGREKEHEYEVIEKVEEPCEEVIVDGKIIGYIKIAKKDSFYGTTLYNENGKVVPFECATTNGATKDMGLEVKRKNGEWIAVRPDTRGWNWRVLYILDKFSYYEDDSERLYVIKDEYDYAKRLYIIEKAEEDGLVMRRFGTVYRIGDNKKISEAYKKYAEEFDEKFKDRIIDLKVGY